MVAAARRIQPLGSLGFGAGVGSGAKVTAATTFKRKTPSELRVKLYTPTKENCKKVHFLIPLMQHIAISFFFPLFSMILTFVC